MKTKGFVLNLCHIHTFMCSFTFRMVILPSVVPQSFKTVLRFTLTFFFNSLSIHQFPPSSNFWYEHTICAIVLVFSWHWEPSGKCFPVRAACLKEAKSTCLSTFQHLGLLQGNTLWGVNNSFNIIKKIFVLKSIGKSSVLEHRSYEITADLSLTWTLSSERDSKQWYVSSTVCLLSQMCC